MDVTSATATQTTGTTQTASASTSGAISADFETFLTMLTAQMQNQDPLNPMESTDLSVQLATFSGVEQQVLTNELLQTMSAALGLDGISQYSSWIGKEARAAADVYFTGQPLTLALEPETLADKAELIVSNDVGAVVQRLQVDTESGTYTWTGEQDSGIPLADGFYTLELESLSDGATIGRTQVETYQQVTEARLGDDGVEIVLSGGTVVDAEQVSALRNPSN